MFEGKFWALIPLALTALALAACGSKSDDAAKTEASVPVEVAQVVRGGIDAAYRGTATLEAEDEAVVVAKTGGVVQEVLVEEGTRVKAGQTLAKLETERLALQVAQARADSEKADENYERNTRIFEKNLISKELYDQSRYARDAARAAYDLAALTLKESQIQSPFDGVVSARFVKRGNSIQPGTQAFRVTRMDRLQAQVYVPERDIHKIKPGQPATLAVDAWPDRRFTGAILRVNPVIDASTGTVKVTVAMAPDVDLKPGMFGRVEIRYDRREQAVLVPKDALLSEDAALSVFVVADGKAHRRTVRTGYDDGDHAEVLDGLKPGDQVVTTGQANLKDDAKVEVVNAATALGGGSGGSAASAAH